MAAITLVIVQISVCCTTIFLHRTKTHRGLELHPVVGFLMHLHLAIFTGVIPREWAAVHRKHHHFQPLLGVCETGNKFLSVITSKRLRYIDLIFSPFRIRCVFKHSGGIAQPKGAQDKSFSF